MNNMASISTSPHVNVSQCSLCQRNTEFHCKTCCLNLCQPCKRTHTISLDTKDHNVTLYRERFNSLYKKEMCATHPDQAYERYCETCDLPVCLNCREHKKHKLHDIRTMYEYKRKLNEETVINTRSETLYNVCRLRSEFKTIVNNDLKIFREKMAFHRSTMVTKSQKMIKFMNIAKSDSRHHNQVHQWSIHLVKTIIAKVQEYEKKYEEFTYKPVRLLQFVKKSHYPQIKDTFQLYKYDLINQLSKIQTTHRGKRLTENGLVLTLMSSPVLLRSLEVKCVNVLGHMTHVTKDQVWINDCNSLILADTITFDTLYRVDDSLGRMHTVNRNNELMYIDKDKNIKKLSNDKVSTTILRKNTDYKWEPRCLYCSPSSGDLLVGMTRYVYNGYKRRGKVTRYNNIEQLAHTMQHFNTPYKLYSDPHYITENNNGDVIVCNEDSHGSAVVVTTRDGMHRFSYTGPSSRSRLSPAAICTDALSHILVCDHDTDTVHMIDKDGQFLSYLLTDQSPGMEDLWTMSYDKNAHQLLVGMHFNTVSVYRYIDRQISFNDLDDHCDNEATDSHDSRTAIIPGYSQEEYVLFAARSKAEHAANFAEERAEKVKKAAMETAEEVSKIEDMVKQMKKAMVITEENIKIVAKYSKRLDAAKAEAKQIAKAASKAEKAQKKAKAAAEAALIATTGTAAKSAVQAARRAAKKAAETADTQFPYELWMSLNSYYNDEFEIFQPHNSGDDFEKFNDKFNNDDDDDDNDEDDDG